MDPQSLSDTLDQILTKMNTDEWDDLYLKASPSQKKAALKLKVDVNDLRSRLDSEMLQTMVNKFEAEEQALLDGQAAVQKALNQFQSAETVLNAITNFVKVVLKVASYC
jgi:hypothetical protein